MAFKLFKKEKKPAENPLKTGNQTGPPQSSKAGLGGEPQKKVVVGASQLARPHVTEKATALTEKNQYVFVTAPNATKIGVKNAVQQFYNVDVEQVRIIHVPSKRMRLGRIEGIKKGYKKAMVKLKEGQSIEILPR